MRTLVIRKKHIFSLLLAAILVSLAIFLPFSVEVFLDSEKKTIVIDAGHGGEDGGVTGVKSGVKESDLNLQMSKIVGEYLESAGFRVVHTRKNSYGLYKSLFRKREDMDKRVEIINRAKPIVAVSLHMNFYSSASRRGAQVFFDKDSESSRSFASIVQGVLNSNFNLPDIGREYSSLSAEKYLFWKVSVPIIIVECGFLSNPIDEANLLDPEYRSAMGYAIFQGIAAYVSTVNRL